MNNPSSLREAIAIIERDEYNGEFITVTLPDKVSYCEICGGYNGEWKYDGIVYFSFCFETQEAKEFVSRIMQINDVLDTKVNVIFSELNFAIKVK